jgi:hypothetical protein
LGTITNVGERRSGLSVRSLAVVLCGVVSACGANAAVGGPTSRPEPPVSAEAPEALPDSIVDPAAEVTLPAAELTPIATTAAAPTLAAGLPADWVKTENSRIGSDGWTIKNQTKFTFIEGYADATSAAPGESVTLFVNTESDRWHAQIYRLGYYGGTRGRLVAETDWTKTPKQKPLTYDKANGLAEARWDPSLRFVIPADWLSGIYIFKLATDDGAQYQLPITVRNDHATGDLVFVSAVTSWQAYNLWGGCSLYECPGDRSRARANVVSFDRPYAREYQNGSADLLDHELGLVALIEELGLPVSYVTDIDLHSRPALATGHRAILSPAHDEYYTTAMRRTLEAARSKGTNLAFFGANAIYRKIRLEPSWDGRANRREVNYRSAKDPGTKGAVKETTVEWRIAPINEPEAALVGVQYACANVDAPMKISNAAHWVFAGTKVTEGQSLPSLVGNEFDTVAAASPKNLDVLARSPVSCGGGVSGTHNMSYYSASSGAGVFATGTIWWICALDALCSVPENKAFVRGVTANVLQAFAAGPAGTAHPSGKTTPGKP